MSRSFIWLVVGLGSASVGIALWKTYWARREARLFGDADYVRQVRTWYERPPLGDEPTITPLDLPKVKPLKGRLKYSMPMGRLREFGSRRERS